MVGRLADSKCDLDSQIRTLSGPNCTRMETQFCPGLIYESTIHELGLETMRPTIPK